MSLAEDQLLFECGLGIDPQIAISWRIVGCKLMYYRPDLVHPSWHKELKKSDPEYDSLEASYSGSYTTDMVGIDLNRPSVKLVVSKYSKPRAG